MKSFNKWTEKEISFLAQNSGNLTLEAISKKLNRSTNSIMQRISTLELNKQK